MRVVKSGGQGQLSPVSLDAYVVALAGFTSDLPRVMTAQAARRRAIVPRRESIGDDSTLYRPSSCSHSSSSPAQCMLSRLLPHILRPSVSPVLQRPRPINLRAACRSMAATSKKRPASPTGADKPQPDEIAPEAKRRHVEQDVPQPTQEGADEAKSKKEADDDWFKGMLCASRRDSCLT